MSRDVSPEQLSCERFIRVRTCPICGAGPLHLVGSRSTIHPRPAARFAILSCSSCAHWVTDPLPDQQYLLELYGTGSLSVFGEGWEDATRSAFDGSDALDPKFAWIAQREGRQPPGRYLELGPGDGGLLRHFESRGWSCHAIEPGAWARASTNYVESVEMIPRGLRFDVIAASDVLEHLSDPLGTVRQLSNLLVTPGRAYFAFPNCTSLRAKLQHEQWRMIRPLGHLHYFSHRSVSELLIRSDLELVHVETYDSLTPLGQQMQTMRRAVMSRAPGRAVSAAKNIAMSLVSEAISRGDQWRVVASRRGSA